MKVCLLLLCQNWVLIRDFVCHIFCDLLIAKSSEYEFHFRGLILDCISNTFQVFCLLNILWSESESRSIVSDSLRPLGLEFSRPEYWIREDLQGIFLIQGLNPGLPHCRQILYQLSQKGRPGILEWIAYPFSSGSSQPRNWTGVSWIAGEFFTNWTIKKAI